MPPRGVKSPKRKRQYEHIKEGAKKRGKSTKRAKEIAARTVNKQRRESGQTKSSKSGATRSTRKSSRKTTRKSRRRTSTKKKTASKKR